MSTSLIQQHGKHGFDALLTNFRMFWSARTYRSSTVLRHSEFTSFYRNWSRMTPTKYTLGISGQRCVLTLVTRILRTSKEAKENELEERLDQGYHTNSPTSTNTENFRPESPLDSEMEFSTPSPRPTLSEFCGSALNQSSPPISRTLTSVSGQKIIVKALLPQGVKIGNTEKISIKCPRVATLFKQIPAGNTRHIRFSVKYFGKEMFTWDARERANCRLTSSKAPLKVKYPNKEFCEKTITRVSHNKLNCAGYREKP